MADALQVMLSSYLNAQGGLGSATNFALNANNDAIEFLVQAKEAATITRLGIRHASTTGTSPTYRVSIQGIDASGNPDGTIKGGGSPASATFSPSGLSWGANSWQWVTLANSYAVAAGEFFAVVIDYSSGTIDGSNTSSFTQTFGLGGTRFPYSIQNDAGSRTRSANLPCVAWGSSTTAYGFPASAVGSTAYQVGSATDELAARFVIPAGWCDTFKVAGVKTNVTLAASGSVKVILYGTGTSGTEVLQDVTADQDHNQNTSSNSPNLYWFDESTLATLTAGTTYRIGVQPQGAQNVTIAHYDVANNADLAAWPGGIELYTSTRADGGTNAWTDVTTRRLGLDLILADITEPTGGGGSPRFGDMTGGLK
jgi:hypothetical protein